MPVRAALQAAREQLKYWQRELCAAHDENDDERVVRCEQFVAQCEIMIDALTKAESRPAGRDSSGLSGGDAFPARSQGIRDEH